MSNYDYINDWFEPSDTEGYCTACEAWFPRPLWREIAIYCELCGDHVGLGHGDECYGFDTVYHEFETR